ncbi:MAG: hypothetical protein RJA36_2993 [Pseudomonadota bacterium]|jgi:TPR repeat protein
MANTSKPTWNHAARHLAATLLLAALAILPPLSHAGLKEGSAAYAKADYAGALKELAPLAEKGNAQAQLLLGKMNSLGQGMPQDKKEAARWFHLAAEQGLAQAQSVLGYLCLVGEGVQQNNELALEWTRKAALQGDANAQFNLSVMHGEPHGIRKDPAESLKWLRQAAEHGQAAALNTLGHLYEQGKGGVGRAPASAWFLIAASAEKGHGAAGEQLKKLEGQLSASELRTGRDMLKRWRSGTRLSRLL